MGDKDGEHRHNLLKPYQVNAELMSLAQNGAIFMHCLPAHRGEEVTDEVIDSPQWVVFDRPTTACTCKRAFWRGVCTRLTSCSGAVTSIDHGSVLPAACSRTAPFFWLVASYIVPGALFYPHCPEVASQTESF